jgi:hypothetical protein
MAAKNSTVKANGPHQKAEVVTAQLKGLGSGPDWNPRQAATQVEVGDVVRLRKEHPCGSFDWKVVRIGADIGLVCVGCERKILLTRADFEKRFKNYLIRASENQDQVKAR